MIELLPTKGLGGEQVTPEQGLLNLLIPTRPIEGLRVVLSMTEYTGDEHGAAPNDAWLTALRKCQEKKSSQPHKFQLRIAEMESGWTEPGDDKLLLSSCLEGHCIG